MSGTDTELFIRTFRKYRLLLLACFIMVTLGAAYYLQPKVLRYRGQATFYISPDPQASELLQYKSQDAKTERWKVTRSHERVLQFVYSGTMMDHIIKGYDLYRHYGIDTTDDYHRGKAISLLSDRVEVYKINPDIFRIAVYDRNNEFAAAMANSIVRYLEVMNRNYYQRALQRDLSTYRNFLAESQKSVSEQHLKLEKALSVVKEISLRNNGSPEVKQIVHTAGEDIREAADAVSAITEGAVNTLALYSQATELSDPGEVNTVVMVRKAYPELSSKKKFLIFYSIASGLAASIMLLGFIYFITYYRPLLVRLFGR